MNSDAQPISVDETFLTSETFTAMLLEMRFEQLWKQHASEGWWPNIPPSKVVREILNTKDYDYPRKRATDHIIRKDLFIATGGNLQMLQAVAGALPSDDRVYRVGVFPDGIDVICFGLESVDSTLEGHYDRLDLLPKWVQERLALLNMIPPTPPTCTVDGVGRRISAHVYWVFAPDASTSA